jgi:WD40 repeat protein
MPTLFTTVRVTFLIVWLAVGAAYSGPTSQPPGPAQGGEVPRLAAGPATPPAPAGGPPTAPLLRLDTGMHTAGIIRIGLDAANRYLVTGSEDKTVRVWELASGRLLRTIRPPIGADNEGKIFSVALSPDGQTVAAGGVTGRAWDGSYAVYLFDRESGQLLRRLTGLPDEVFHLAFSRDGRFLVVTLRGTNGMRLYRTQDYTQVASDKEYGSGGSHWADFDASGRLATTSRDGFIRLYNRDWQLQVKRKAPSGTRPHSVAFSPDGTRVAVGFEDSTTVDVLSGQDLSPLYAPDTTGVGNGDLASVCWSADGRWLYAGGGYQAQNLNPIRRWAEGGKGAASNLPAAQNSITHILPLTTGGVVFGAFEPSFGVLDAVGKRQLFQSPTGADFRGNRQGFRSAHDGATVQFNYELSGQSPVRFALHDRALVLQPAADPALVPPLTSAPGLNITGWDFTETPALNGQPLKLWPYERARSVAIAPDHQHFLLGAQWSLRLFDRQGVEQWRKSVPGVFRTVNIAGNGQVAVATAGDGTLRWYRLRDGKELLAFFPHQDRKRWVLWTPTGYYDASPGAEELIGWHMNRGRDAAADFFPAARFRSTFFRPDVVAEVLQTLDEAEALRRADAAAQRTPQTVEIAKRLPPVIQVHAPQDGAVVSTPTIAVRFSIRTPSGEPVTTIKGLVDGRPIIQTQGLQMLGKEGEIQEVQLPLPQRDSEVAIIAENRYAASEPATVRLRWGGAAEVLISKPKLYVLAIGISRYQDASLTLGLAAKDAADFAAVLQRQHGNLYREVEVKLLTDTIATKGNILDGLEWLERQTTSKDVAAVFLAGHGVNDRNGDYYFLPVDAVTERLKRTGVAFTDLKNTVTALPGKVLFFIDTCHAGNIMGQRRGLRDTTRVVNELASAENGVVVFAASTGNQYSREDQAWGNGAFTKALVEGLYGKADYPSGGRITVTMLDLYLSERVKELTKGQQTPTTVKPQSIPDFPVALVP